jgi:hypothetical protein
MARASSDHLTSWIPPLPSSNLQKHSKAEPCTTQPTPEDTLCAKPGGREKKSWGREKTTSHFPEGDQIPISDKSGTGGGWKIALK